MEILLALVAIVLILTPILAISAFVRVQKLESLGKNLHVPDLIARVYALEQRLAALEKALSGRAEAPAAPTTVATYREMPKPAPPVSLQEQGQQPAPIRPREPTPRAEERPSLFAARPLHGSRQEEASHLDMETLIAGRWLNRIGILALLFAVSFFVKYAFDNNWVGPTGRVAIGVLLGSAMLPWSHWLLSRGYSYFSEGIAGLGEAVLYVSIWAGWHYYGLFSQGVAFGALIVVTAVMTIVALGRNSERIAVLSLIGGFLTPEIVSTGRDQQIVLFTYLAILGASLLVIASRKDWVTLAPLSFIFTQVYFWGWYETFYVPAKLERTILFGTMFFVLYAAIPVLRAARRGQLGGLDIALVLVNAGSFLIALRTMLWPEHRWGLTVAVLLLSAAHLGVARSAPAPKDGESPLTRLLFAGLALTFVTLAIPIRLDGRWITIGFSVEGAILLYAGLRSKMVYLRYAGHLLFVIVAFRLIFLPIEAKQFLFNQRFAAYAVFVVSLAAALYEARREWSSLGDNEHGIFAVLAVAINVFSLLGLSLEFWDYFGRAATAGVESSLAQHLALSVLWTIYATGLILLGVKRQSPLLRWQALALYGLVAGKVFIYDSSYLERFYRILSFLILGIVLVVVSFLYQRKILRERSES